ncbi:MAG: SWIM zinc finger domain-containing protein, partial [Cyanobacteria bacterium P01_D01_bin.6]
MGDRAAALEARILAFKAQPSFKGYCKLEELAATDWFELQGELLQYLRTARDWGKEQAQVDIFLHEGLMEDAIAAVSGLRSYRGDLILRVMDAVVDTHSQWVLDNARRRAKSIMDEGKAKYYHHAVNWLKRVKAA